MDRRPDVVKELNLNDGLQSAYSLTNSATDNVCLGQRRIEGAVAAEFGLQARRQLKDAALALDQSLTQILLAAAVGHVLAKDDDARIAPHLVLQAGVDEIRHRPFLRIGSLRRLRLQLGAGRVVVLRIDMQRNTRRLRKRRAQRPLRRLANFFVDLLLKAINRLGIENTLAQQEHLHLLQRIAQRIGFQLTLGPISAVVVRKRMRVRPDHMAMHKRRTVAGAAVSDRLFKNAIACNRIGAVNFGKVEVREVGNELRDIAAGSIYLDRRGNGILVVLDHEEHRKLLVRRRIQRLPELALAGRAFAKRGVDNFIAVEGHIFESAIIAIVLLRRFRMAREIAPGLGAANGMQHLRGSRRRLRHDVQLRIAPVRRHLPPATRWIGSRADGLQQQFFDGAAEGQAKSAVAIVREEPVIAGLERQARRNQQSLVSGPGNLEKDLLLPFEHDLPVVSAPREIHEAVDLNQSLEIEAGYLACFALLPFADGRFSHSENLDRISL